MPFLLSISIYTTRIVVLKTKEFVDAAAYNSRTDKISVIAFLNDNTIKFKDRKIIDHEFYDDYLIEIRKRMLEMYEAIDAVEMEQLFTDSSFSYEKLHVKNSYTYKLKEYDEKEKRTGIGCSTRPYS